MLTTWMTHLKLRLKTWPLVITFQHPFGTLSR